MADRAPRVLIVGRSGSVLLAAVAMLRDRGYGANASNQFDRLLDDYDPREVDLVMFGGMVPPGQREFLRERMTALHQSIRFLQGLGGIAPLLVAQVEEFSGGPAPGVDYDAGRRVFRIALTDAEHVVVEGLWAEFVPPEPLAQSIGILDGELPAGAHEVAVPEQVPQQGSYATVRVGRRVSAFQIGETPESVKQLAGQSLPAPEPVTTHLPWS